MGVVHDHLGGDSVFCDKIRLERSCFLFFLINLRAKKERLFILTCRMLCDIAFLFFNFQNITEVIS